MRIRKIFAALLAVSLLAAFAACGGDDDFRFMQSANGKIRQADVECMQKYMNAMPNGGAAELEDALIVLAEWQAVIWEAKSLDLGESWEEARAWAEEDYAGIKALADNEDSRVWEIRQNYLEKAGMTEAEYLDYLAWTYWGGTTKMRLFEYAQSKTDDVWNRSQYAKSLLEKYYDDLVEDDLLPLLDEVLEKWESYYEAE